MIHKMTDLKSKAPHPLKNAKSMEFPYFYKGGYWGLGEMNEYLEYLFQKVFSMSH